MSKFEKSRISPELLRLRYRADIEGLRAVAILLVVAAHAGMPWLKGGYIGVDVFFVLSGYLITGLLVQEIRVTGRVRLWEFYARRLRRLLPALLFALMGTIVLAVLLLAPSEQISQADTIRIVPMWATNILFALADFDYFSPAVNSNLALHTWSLGVEEQFYLVWPVFLLFLFGAWRWQSTRLDVRRVYYGLAATGAACLALSIFLSYTKPLWGFYFMPSRAWQFALGALIFLGSTRSGTAIGGIHSIKVSRGVSVLMVWGGWMGLGLILTAAVLLDTKIAYPGIWALLPSVGAALILMAGSTVTSAGLSRLLSIAPFQGVGRVSYSWYLWHWPILTLGTTISVSNELLPRVVLVIISLLMAVFSYFVVESPIRNSKVLAERPKLVVALSMLLMASAVVVCSGWRTTAMAWTRIPQQYRYEEIRADLR